MTSAAQTWKGILHSNHADRAADSYSIAAAYAEYGTLADSWYYYCSSRSDAA